jgi:rare lipoprotein A
LKAFLRILFLLAFLFYFSCAPKIIYPPPQVQKVQYGLASWYGEAFHGKVTSSGEIFDMNELTAAHNFLPLGTLVMVTHLGNGRSVLVKIKDRGPLVEGRIIDLSYAAAKALGMVEEGVAWVKVEVVSFPEGPLVFGYTLQVGAFSEERMAKLLCDRLKAQGFAAYMVPFKTESGTYWRVRIGNFLKEKEARAFAEKLRLLGYDVIIMAY